MPATLPPGQRVYAIGDVHGCTDRLLALHDQIRQDLADHPIAHPLIIHLGDAIDRGPDSAGTLELMRTCFPQGPRVLNLMGNHEEMFLTALATGHPDATRTWLANGGVETLQSWGLPWSAPPDTWAAAIPPVQRGFLRGLSLLYRVGGYLFVHAGVRPDLPLEQQVPEDLLWIREPFLSFGGTLDVVVVHGHTPEDAPVVLPHRIGIDTGAVLGGKLTCAVLETDSVRFLQS
jgi:serine/threonine protein phosphatase 1